LLALILFHQRAEDVRKRFVERARLLEINQPGFGFRHAMAELMAHHVNGDSKAVENFAITVAEDHLLPVPEGVLVFASVMDSAAQHQPFVVQRIALIGFPEKFVRDAEIVVGFIYGDVAIRRLAFAGTTTRCSARIRNPAT